MAITIVMTGPFTERDISDLAAALRAVERKQPERNFGFYLTEEESDQPPEALMEQLQRIFPGVEGIPFDVKKIWSKP